MNDEAEDGSSGPPRVGDRWTQEDVLQLLDGVQRQETLEEIAAGLGRNPSAVATRLQRYLLPPGARTPRRQLVTVLAALLADGYDWQGTYAARLALEGSRHWPPQDQQYLREAYQHRTPITEITNRLWTSESQVSRQMIRQGLATTYREVIDQVGCIPGGSLDLGRRVADADYSVTLYVLATWHDACVVPRGAVTVSLHSTKEEALGELDRISRLYAADHQGDEEEHVLTWMLDGCVPGRSAFSVTPRSRLCGDPTVSVPWN